MVSLPAPDPFILAAGLDDAPGVRILVVGDLARWKTRGRLHDMQADCEFIAIADLTNQTIRATAPDVVVSALVAADFDATDVARRLRAARFAGRYCAVANDLPDEKIIYQEIRSIAPLLAFDLINLPPTSGADSG